MTAEPADRTEHVLDVESWRREVLSRAKANARFAGVFTTSREGDASLSALMVDRDRIFAIDTLLDEDAYPALTPELPSAFWYERALHDLAGIRPVGHPRLDPLLLPLSDGAVRPMPGRARVASLTPAEVPGPTDVTGHGMFTIPHGPVRSGVFESVEYLIETPGEDIPHLNIRPHYKHRGIAKRFEGLRPEDGVLVAERVEGIASVAHALGFCHAIESLAELEISERAGLVRVLHAELERVANHLDVATRLCDAAGLAVATARFGWHKETVMRLVSRLCGNRFGRGVVVPGGIGYAEFDPADLGGQLLTLRRRVEADSVVLMRTASFLDRLRGTGVLDPDLARARGALGPIGRACGYDDDHRRLRPYDGYRYLRVQQTEPGAGDAMARLSVRWQEVSHAFDLLHDCLEALSRRTGEPRQGTTRAAPDGRGLGVAEAPQGEVFYSVEMLAGQIVRCLARSASFHNLPLFHDVFHGDILTDFPFIEASFGLSIAGAAM